jgi:hypothetical protein
VTVGQPPRQPPGEPPGQPPGQPPRDPVEARLDLLRGRAMPVNHDARTISALAANPGCPRRALMDAAGVHKHEIAKHVGLPAPYGLSPFARSRGNAFEAQVKENSASLLLALLREHIGLDIASAHYDDLSQVGAGESTALRHVRTRHKLLGADPRTQTMFDHPLLRLKVGGRYAYLEPDLLALHHEGRWYVVEVKSFAIIDGQADPEKVAAAAIQSAVYVHALRDLLGPDPGTGASPVHHETILVAPENFANKPSAARLDVRKQLGVIGRQLDRIASIDSLLGACPADLTFDLDPGPDGRPRRAPGELRGAIETVIANYAPECLATCELCFVCRDEARAYGDTGALGKSVREDLGGIETIPQALGLARGALSAAPEREEISVKLKHAAQIWEQLTGQAV